MKTTLFASLLGVGVIIGGLTHAQDSVTLQKIQDSKTITLGYRDISIPFSFLDEKQRPLGYSIDICLAVAEHIKTTLKLDHLDIKYVPVTSPTRIPLIQNGTIDLECGASSNNLDRQKQVSFAPTTFVTGTRWVSKATNQYTTLQSLKGKTVVSTAGTSNLKWLTHYNAEHQLGLNVISATEHGEAFLMVQTGRAAAFFMDDVLIYGLVANANRPGDFYVSDQALTREPYAIMLRKDDPEFKKVVDQAVVNLMSSGKLVPIYQRWFEQPIPPRDVVLNLPMSDALKKVIQYPTDSGDSDHYK